MEDTTNSIRTAYLRIGDTWIAPILSRFWREDPKEAEDQWEIDFLDAVANLGEEFTALLYRCLMEIDGTKERSYRKAFITVCALWIKKARERGVLIEFGDRGPSPKRS